MNLKMRLSAFIETIFWKSIYMVALTIQRKQGSEMQVAGMRKGMKRCPLKQNTIGEGRSQGRYMTVRKL